MGEIISILSGKGGTGKTIFCVCLGCVLNENYKKNILLFDADMGLNNIDLYLNIEMENKIEKIIDNKKKYNKTEIIYNYNYKLNTTSTSKLDVVSGCSGDMKFANLDKDQIFKITNFINENKDNYDYTIVDNSPGLYHFIFEVCLISDKIIIITNSEYPSLIDAYQTAKILISNYSINPGKIGFFFNRVDNYYEAISKFNGIKNILKRFTKNSLVDKLKFLGNLENINIMNKLIINNDIPLKIQGVKKTFIKTGNIIINWK